VGFVLSSLAQRVVSRPIVDLDRVARTVSERRDFSVRAKKYAEDEIGVLVDAFNEMLSQIQARDAELTVAKEEAESANKAKFPRFRCPRFLWIFRRSLQVPSRSWSESSWERWRYPPSSWIPR